MEQPSATPADIVAFMHAALFSPAISTLTQAIDKGYIHHFPGLTAQTIRRHPPFSTATVKGHQDQIRKNVRSTKTQAEPVPSDPCTDAFPSDNPQGDRTHYCYTDVHEITGQIFTDQTGKFVLPSSNGNKYLWCYMITTAMPYSPNP
jgi:hypothetical protein